MRAIAPEVAADAIAGTQHVRARHVQDAGHGVVVTNRADDFFATLLHLLQRSNVQFCQWLILLGLHCGWRRGEADPAFLVWLWLVTKPSRPTGTRSRAHCRTPTAAATPRRPRLR